MDIRSAVDALSALAHEGRLTIIRHLIAAGPIGMSAGMIASAADLSATTASGQLTVLRQANLVTKEREGRSIIYRAKFDSMAELLTFLAHDCCRNNPVIRTAVLGACCP